MKIGSVSFGSGLLLYKGQYINPDQIKKFGSYKGSEDETRVIYNNTTNDIIKVSPEYFAVAWLSAKVPECKEVISLDHYPET